LCKNVTSLAMADAESKALDPLTAQDEQGQGDAWYGQNFTYFSATISQIHYQLYRAIARQRQDPETETALLPPPDPAAIAATMATPPALTRLCATLGLSDFERNVLLLCAGRALNPEIPNLCAVLHGQGDQNYVTFQLALKIFTESHWQALTPRAPLRQWQLITWAAEEDIPHARLNIDESILHYLLGEPYDDPLLKSALQPVAVAAISGQLSATHRGVVEDIATLLQRQPTAKVQLCGPETELRWAIAAAVAARQQQPLYGLNAQAVSTDNASQFTQRWQRWVRLAPSLLVIDADQERPAAETSAGNPPLLTQLLPRLEAPVIVTTHQRHYVPQCALVSFDVVRLSYGEQLTLWQTALGTTSAEMNGHLHGLVSQFNLPPATIAAAGLSVQTDAGEAGAATDQLADHLWQFCRLQARPQLDNLAQRIDTNATWDDLVLPEREKTTLKAIATQVQYRAQVYEDWGFAGKSQRGLGISAMFAGQSGTGKTMAAEVLAKQFKLDLYRIDLSSVVSKYIGETEKNLRRIFDAAESGGAVLLFDEADALFGKRTEVKDSHDRHANVEVSYLLQRMESYQGLAILTTNLKKSLDQAFMRRIRFIVDFPFPDREARTEIWRRVFPAQSPTRGLKYEKLGNLSVAGGNIRTIALNAAFIAAAAGKPIQMGHILAATQQEYLKLERTLTDTEVRGWVPKG
jgi:hypothetical protein